MSNELSIFEDLSEERKQLQEEGKLPSWFTTMGWQMFKDKYLYEADTYEEQIDRIVLTLRKHCKTKGDYFSRRWKAMLMENHAYLATPALGNTGTDRGFLVSCSGGYIPDSVYGFYTAQREAAMLSKKGFGTSGYLGDIRERGTPITEGGKASGALPVFKDFVQLSQDISQGSTRRGAWAGYLPAGHGDFWEIADYVKNNPDSANVGWNFDDKFIARLEKGSNYANSVFCRTLMLKALTGKGYFFFPDKVNRQSPQMYKDLDLSVKASNLCTEITLHSDEEHTYTCVISGMVATTYDDWKDTDAVYCMTVMLDCMVEEFLDLAKGVKGLEKAVRGTEKGRPIGLGLTGLHSLFQKKRMPFGGFDAHMLNNEVYKHLQTESLKASQWMAEDWGEPEWCKGYGVRNTHRTAQAPNVSSSLIFGTFSQGSTPWYGNVYNEGSASGGMFRVNPEFINLLSGYGQYNDEVINSVLDNKGSCQHLEFLSEEDKEVFRTAFEINQEDILRLASKRQEYICQAQSTNLFFDADEDEAYIAQIHKKAFLDENILSLYYMRSKAGVAASRGVCSACES
tara:strand:- start:8331 stop:10034 length:1704 start_codon:yes stop_codon:yes gene_type:complete